MKNDSLKPYKCLLVDFNNKDNKISEKIKQLLMYKGNFKLIDEILEW